MSVACQFCGSNAFMHQILNLGYMPPPNDMPPVGHRAREQQWLPTELWFCEDCELAQLGYVPDQTVAFPPDYPYTSSATPALRKNFEDLALKCESYLKTDDLIVDIGANDGTLLSCFSSAYRRWGVEPTDVGHLAPVNMFHKFFDSTTAKQIVETVGKAKLITCTNCFAHMPDIHDVVESIKLVLADDGIFVSESHYLVDLIRTLQYDTIYAEHLRYYSITSVCKLLDAHGLYPFKVDRIPTHGGSIRVYASKKIRPGEYFEYAEKEAVEMVGDLHAFAKKVQDSKLAVLGQLALIKGEGGSVVGIGAPSRGSTVINYLRLDRGMLDYVCEQPHSLKIGRLMPGTDVPVVDEKRLYEEQPEAAILFSWHLADELIPKIRAKGYHGQIILPCSATIVHEPVEISGAA